jgi:AcrR family transcriptional regulator
MVRAMEGLRARKLEKTRNEIIRVALTLFLRKGFDATSVEEIAAAAEVAPRTFYRYFPTKEHVIFVDQEAEDEALRRELKTRAPGESDFDVLARALRAAHAVTRSELGEASRVHELVQRTPALQVRSMQLALRWEELIVAGLLASQGSRGKSRIASLRARVLASSAIAALRVATDLWLEGGCRGSLEAQAGVALGLLRDGFDDT